MIAKYSGRCKVTGQEIIAGQTEIAKVDGIWQAKTEPKETIERLVGPGPRHGEPRFEVKGLDKSGDWVACGWDTAFDAFCKVWEHIHGRDWAIEGNKFRFATAGTVFESHLGLSVRVNWNHTGGNQAAVDKHLFG